MNVDDLRSEAFAICDRADKALPDSADPLIVRGNLHRRFGNRTEAIKCWKRALERNPKRVEVYYLMAVMAEDNGDFGKVAELCTKARGLHPALKGVNQKLGKAFLELGKPAEAVGAFKEALVQAPGAVDAHVGLGRAHVQLKQYKEARASYAKAVELNPKDSRGHYGMAMALRNLGQKELAKESLKKFTDLRKDENKTIEDGRRKSDDLPWMRRTVSATHTSAAQLVYLRNRQLPPAEQHLVRACRLDLKNQSCRQRLLRIYFIQKRFDEAVTLLGDDIKEAPDNPAAYKSLVTVLMQGKRDFPAAVEIARKLVKLDPNGENYYALSAACEANNDISGAWDAIQRAFELARDTPAVKQAYLRLQIRVGI
jgi:tetratricopeptide (TPR) repeat protein